VLQLLAVGIARLGSRPQATASAALEAPPELGRRLRHHWRIHFDEDWRERLFLASVSFFGAFAAIRGLTHAIRSRRGPFRNVQMRGLHVHHLVWGIALLHVVGYGWLAAGERMLPRRWAQRLAAVGYGAGAAMTLDEFALWLRLEDVYWSREGRQSVDAVVLFGSVLAAGASGHRFFRAVGRDLVHVARRLVGERRG
jgi:hypothetical protein